MAPMIHQVDQVVEEEEEEEEEIERELAQVTFGDLQKAKSNGSHSLLYHNKSHDHKKTGGRANKNRPMEVSSKKPVPRFREVVQAPKKRVCDPRFEPLCGTVDEDGFRKRFEFLFENELPKEKEELQKQLKRTRDPKAVDELKNRISWIDKQVKSGSTKRADAHILTQHKKKEREQANKGKQPYFLKKSEIRKQRLVGQYEELKASGKLESFMEKKRRKNASKDHKYMPYRRPDTIGQPSH